MICKQNIVITGFMGTGKSTVAVLIARKFNRPFIDTDQEIEKRLGTSINDIFSRGQEQLFRESERVLLKELSEQTNLVIATGGGTLLSRSSLQLLEQSSLFCLDASVDNLVQRLYNCASRPLLNHDNLRYDIENLLDDRRCNYQRIDQHISTDHLSPEEIATTIINRIEARNKAQITRSIKVQPRDLPPYPIFIAKDVLNRSAHLFKSIGASLEQVIIADSNLQEQSEKLRTHLLNHGFKTKLLSIDAQESEKTLVSAEILLRQLAEIRCSRASSIIAFGGGVVGDIGAFVAATYMRGLSIVQIPTTLLAMVDSSIGGKCGLNLQQSKNLIGVFKHPQAVIIDPCLLYSLPQQEVSAGLAEVIKHGLIGDEELLCMLEADAYNIEELIFRNLCVKAKIVAADSFEKDQRMLLNFGHTFGHAFESVSQHRIKHGPAVGLGMLVATRLAILMNQASEKLYIRIENLLTKHKLPISLNNILIDDVLSALELDKKHSQNNKHFIIPLAAQQLKIITNPPEILIRKAIESILYQDS